MERQQLEAIIHKEIPVTIPMAISVSRVDDEILQLAMELQANINHKSTAFGGSLYVLCVLTGWAYIYNRLHDMHIHAHIVIQSSEIDYLKPVTDDFTASCEPPEAKVFEKFIKTFNKLGKARIKLPVIIQQTSENAVVFTGSYVIHK